MTIPSDVCRDDYLGNNAVADYDFTFSIEDQDHVLVVVALGTADEITLARGVDYTVAMNDDGTGTVHLTSGNLPSGDPLTLLDGTPFVQTTSYGTAKPAGTTVERSVDRLTRQTRRLQEEISRCLKLPTTEASAYATTVLAPTLRRALHVQAWDSFGRLTLLAADDVSPSAITAQGSTTARSLSERFGEVFNVKDYGARADGVADDLAAINAAIVAANTAGGGTVIVPPGVYHHSAAITVLANVIIRGAGRLATTFKSSHLGDGLVATSPINSSTAVNVAVYDLQIWNTNAANTGAAYVDVGGTFVHLHNIRFRGYAYGVIFDQTELADIVMGDFETQLTAGVWLVNGAEHAVGANASFTNRVSISQSQFNEGATVWGIIDDGGNAHAFTDNNYNGCLGHIRIAGVQNLVVRGGEFESAAGPCIVLSNLSLTGGGKGAALNLHFVGCEFVPVAGQSCINIVSAGIVTWQQCLFGNTSAVKVLGAANVGEMSFLECFNAGGGATFTGSATKMMVWDSNGFALYQLGHGTPIKAHISATKALNFGVPGSVPGEVDLTITVTGVALGDTVDLGLGATLPANYLTTAWVSAADTVTVRLLQYAGAATGQDLGTCRVAVWQH